MDTGGQAPGAVRLPQDEYFFSPVRGGPFRRVRKALGLVPEGGLGLGRRTLALVAVAWLPVVIGALVAGQALDGISPDPLLRHFGVHTRLLISIPLLIFAEARMDRTIPQMLRHFVSSGLVEPRNLPDFREALAAATRLRDSAWGAAFVATVIAGMILASTTQGMFADEMAWAVSQANGHRQVGFGGWWFIFVSRPIFVGLLSIWLWRMLVLWLLVWRISKLELRLVATHPDGVGGLGFLEGLVMSVTPLIVAASVVLAGRWAHEVLYHEVHVDSLKPLVAAFVVLVVIVFNGPLVLLGRSLAAFKRKRLLEYSALVGTHGDLVYRKWIGQGEVGTPELLNAPELGPTVDIAGVYQAVANMRLAPISKRSLIPVVVAALVPLLPVFAIEVPIKEMLKSLAGALL